MKCYMKDGFSASVYCQDMKDGSSVVLYEGCVYCQDTCLNAHEQSGTSNLIWVYYILHLKLIAIINFLGPFIA